VKQKSPSTATFYCPGCGRESVVKAIENLLPSVVPCQCPLCGMWWRIEIEFWPTTPERNFERDGDA
jgi:transcription elongation factor Elf1